MFIALKKNANKHIALKITWLAFSLSAILLLYRVTLHSDSLFLDDLATDLFKHGGKEMMEWLDRCEIPYDEIHLGKPWPGRGGFYVDDKTIRPDEFVKLSYNEILGLIGEKAGGD